MTAPGSSRPLPRRALRAGRVALLVVAVIVSIPVWLVWTLAVALFSVARPFVTVPLGLAMVAACGLAIYFVTQGELASAARAPKPAMTYSTMQRVPRRHSRRRRPQRITSPHQPLRRKLC